MVDVANNRESREATRKQSPAPDDKPPVPLFKRSASHFQRGDRQRGSAYANEGRVRLEVDGNRARARVQGNQKDAYRVGLDWSRVAGERILHTFCECQRFVKGNPCKHLWATLLALEELSVDLQPPGRDRVGLRKDSVTKWTDLIPAEEQRRLAARAKAATARARPARRKSRGKGRRGKTGPLTWREQLEALQDELDNRSGESAEPPMAAGLADRDLLALINQSVSQEAHGLILDLMRRPEAAGKANGKLERVGLDPDELILELEEEDGETRPLPVVAALGPEPRGRAARGRRGGPSPARARVQRLRLPVRLYGSALPGLCSAGVLGWWDGQNLSEFKMLSWDTGPAWRLGLRLEVDGGGVARLRAGLERDGARLPLSAPVLILPAGSEPEDPGRGLVVLADSIAKLDLSDGRDLPWLELLRDADEIVIPREDLESALTSILELPDLPRLEVPEDLRLSEERSPMCPRVVLEPDPASAQPDPPLLAELSFRYGELEVSAADPQPAIVDWEKRAFLRRDMDGEHEALVRLLETGVRPVVSRKGHELELSPRDLPAVVEPLLANGWDVEVRGTTLRSAKPPSLRIESGIDWFELSGSLEFAGDQIDFKEILAAIRRGERFVRLGDGSQGLLPSAFVETYDSLADLAQESSDAGLRFLPSQALLVDALLTAMPPPSVDASFAALRDKLQSFERIKPKREPRGFEGKLRSYQREGLGWLDFLREFGLGGVLADDMGLGKTVQVLALLLAYRAKTKTTGLPYLVVAPRSLVYNWIDETARFTPTLKVVEYGGPDRESLHGKLGEFDLVVTTYGTLRRDIGYLATVEFDTVILDEAQAIKNRDSQAAKASRLLNARHRLALTGTPIENHLGELGSIFEYLNPGLLGQMPRLEALVAGRAASKEELAVVAEGIRPFILRRTKSQVLKDLPPKTEQVLLCTLSDRQRELYDQMRAGYQASLLQRVESQGLSGSSIQVLEALLRLRQIACHPGLVDPAWEDAGSAKLDALHEQVAEVLDEGHKLLVFSQFTSLLAYVRKDLERRAVPYAYLDGQTRNRGEVVERFQTDPDCNLFLISLKAGGTGLNLTAAGYVFLLDPWWNPAVEAQAIDRAHRIGQTQPVFSYRLIAQNTVEEKILELQRSKRQLASALLDGGAQPLRDLTADDLRMLLS